MDIPFHTSHAPNTTAVKVYVPPYEHSTGVPRIDDIPQNSLVFADTTVPERSALSCSSKRAKDRSIASLLQTDDPEAYLHVVLPQNLSQYATRPQDLLCIGYTLSNPVYRDHIQGPAAGAYVAVAINGTFTIPAPKEYDADVFRPGLRIAWTFDDSGQLDFEMVTGATPPNQVLGTILRSSPAGIFVLRTRV